jgi:SAM-dependent methyltransferase
MRPESVLDIGCGDLEVLREIELNARYIGIDVSEEIVRLNTLNFVDKTIFLRLLYKYIGVNNFRSDAVLCLDVIIHQNAHSDYCRLTKKLVKAAKRGGLISGYRSDPRLTVRSPIIAYHEPITETLHSAGAVDVQVVGESLESNCLVFVAFGVPPEKGQKAEAA